MFGAISSRRKSEAICCDMRRCFSGAAPEPATESASPVARTAARTFFMEFSLRMKLPTIFRDRLSSPMFFSSLLMFDGHESDGGFYRRDLAAALDRERPGLAFL